MCGEVEFQVEMPTLFCGHCHCTMCQRQHGAGYVTWIAVPDERLVIQKGGASLERFASSDHGTRSFCRRCGSSLFCVSTHHPGQTDIVLANLKSPIDREPQVHIYWDDRADWTQAEDGLPRLGGATGMEPVPTEETSG